MITIRDRNGRGPTKIDWLDSTAFLLAIIKIPIIWALGHYVF